MKKLVDFWKQETTSGADFYSTLQQNEALKKCLLEATPWVLEAKNEAEQKQQLAQLFNLNRTHEQLVTAIHRLSELQSESGGCSWFKGFQPNREITLYLLYGFSQLTALGAIEYGEQERLMIYNALNYLDKSFGEEFTTLQQSKKGEKAAVLTPDIVHYLFVRSAFRDIPENGVAREAIRFYTNKAEKEWQQQSVYEKAQIANLLWRNGNQKQAEQILNTLRKTATITTDGGMYWANNRKGGFLISPIDVHCLLMSTFQEIAPDLKETNKMKQWLLNQKRTQNWGNVPATVQAVYALLLTGSNWLENNNVCQIKVGNTTYSTNAGEAGTGYLQKVLTGEAIEQASKSPIIIEKTGDAPAWGAIYTQYLQPIQEVKAAGIQELAITKRLFIERFVGTERQLRPITDTNPLQVGDKVIIQLVIQNKQAMDYVCLKDPFASCLEIANQLSGTYYQDGLLYYQTPTDVSVNFFFDRLPAGTFVLEYAAFVSRPGSYAEGITSIQCLYAPEYTAHTGGKEIVAKEAD